MKAEKFLLKLSEKLMKDLSKEDKTEYVVGIDSNNHTMISVLYPDGVEKEYDVEVYRQEHKQTDRPFKDIAKEINQIIMQDIRRHERNANIQITNADDLLNYLNGYINDHSDTAYIFDTWTINGEIAEVIAPTFVTLESNAMSEITKAPYLVIDKISFWQTYDQLGRDAERFGDFMLNKMNEPGYDKIIPNYKDTDSLLSLCCIQPRFLSKYEEPDAYTESLDADGGLRTTYSLCLTDDYIDVASFGTFLPGITHEERMEELQRAAQSAIIPQIYKLGKKIAIVSNQQKKYGAACITDSNTLNEISYVTGSNKVLIVPVTVDELLVVPDNDSMRNLFQSSIEEALGNNPRALSNDIFALDISKREFVKLEAPQKEEEQEEEKPDDLEPIL